MPTEKQLDWLTVEEVASLRSAQQSELVANLSVRALRAELKLAEAAAESVRNEALSLMLRLREAHSIDATASAHLVEEAGGIRFVLSAG